MPKPRIITSLNRKGGVGKTHLCWLIASVCFERGMKCLILDLDPQGNMTSSLLASDDGGRSIESLFDPTGEPNIGELIRHSEYAGIDIVPSSPDLERFNITDQAQWEQADLHLSLSEVVPEIASDYDFIVLDCPPSLSLVSYAALCCSDFVMIPLEAARWGALGTQHIIAAMNHIQTRFNSRLQLLGYVVSRFKKTRSYQQTYLQQLRDHFGSDAFDTVIPDYAAFEKAVTDRIPLTLHSPRSHASHIARTFFDEVEVRAERLSRISRTVRSRGVSEHAHAAT